MTRFVQFVFGVLLVGMGVLLIVLSLYVYFALGDRSAAAMFGSGGICIVFGVAVCLPWGID